MKYLQIVSCILACICTATSVIVGIFFGFLYFAIFAIVAAAFALLMFFAKKKAEPPQPPRPDFMNTEEENAAIRKMQEDPETQN
ncbi:MAG: hypothetical protein IKD43_03825 [Clostridia bacterium]|nr:hypothetical protein [Clostridia bacterium]